MLRNSSTIYVILNIDSFESQFLNSNLKIAFYSPLAGKVRKRVTIGEKEKQYIVQCYNQSHGKEWPNVLNHVKLHIMQAGLPASVVDMYLSQPEERLTGRMSRIIKQELQVNSKQIQLTATQSTAIQDSPGSVLVENRMKYAKRQNPGQRRQDALKAKLYDELVVLSDEDSEDSQKEDDSASNKRKSKSKDHYADSAYKAHKQMCEKALETMDSVKNLLSKVDDILDKSP